MDTIKEAFVNRSFTDLPIGTKVLVRLITDGTYSPTFKAGQIRTGYVFATGLIEVYKDAKDTQTNNVLSFYLGSECHILREL